MPLLKPITVTIDSDPVVYKVAGNNDGVARWQHNAAGLLTSSQTFSVGIRPPKAGQATRKATVVLTDPLISECDQECKPVSRGAIHFRLENVVSAESTLVERTEAYDKFVALLADEDVRNAIINNESFYS